VVCVLPWLYSLPTTDSQSRPIKCRKSVFGDLEQHRLRISRHSLPWAFFSWTDLSGLIFAWQAWELVSAQSILLSAVRMLNFDDCCLVCFLHGLFIASVIIPEFSIALWSQQTGSASLPSELSSCIYGELVRQPTPPHTSIITFRLLLNRLICMLHRLFIASNSPGRNSGTFHKILVTGWWVGILIFRTFKLYLRRTG